MFNSGKGWGVSPFIVGPLVYKGVWNASTNTPTLASGTGNKGDMYLVTVAGTTNLDGINEWAVGDNPVFNGTTWNKLDNTSAGSIDGLSFSISGSGFAITTGIKGDIVIPYDCRITGFTGLADQSGSIAIQLWKDTYVNFPPTVGDLIDTITISAATKTQEIGLSIACSSGDIIRVYVDSVATIQRITAMLNLVRT